jgi:AcrR family transcriptional regulator
MAAVPGLRERKKQQTRERIIEVALKLFETQGFDRTTVAEIAEAADISPRTFFGYFPSKEDVVFHDHHEWRERFRENLRSRAEDESTFDALRGWVDALAAEGKFDRPGAKELHRLVRETPALAARERSHLGEFEEMIAEAVARDLGVAPDALRAHLVAAAAVAALDALGRRHEEAVHEEPIAVLDEALVFLQGGLDALRRHPS